MECFWKTTVPSFMCIDTRVRATLGKDTGEPQRGQTTHSTSSAKFFYYNRCPKVDTRTLFSYSFIFPSYSFQISFMLIHTNFIFFSSSSILPSYSSVMLSYFFHIVHQSFQGLRVGHGQFWLENSQLCMKKRVKKWLIFLKKLSFFG
jgi:hypothetical protein